MRVVTIVALLILCASATADEPSAVEEIVAAKSDTEKAIDLSREVAKCGGLMEAISITLAKLGKVDSAKYFHQTHLGHAVVAGWLLAMEHNQRTGDEKTIDDFSEHVDNIINTRKVWALALIEGGGVKAVEPEMQACVMVNNEIVAPTIKELRASSILAED